MLRRGHELRVILECAGSAIYRAFSVAAPVQAAAANASSSGHTSRPKASAAEQLARVADLQRQVAAENSKLEKAAIISRYPDLRELLE